MYLQKKSTTKKYIHEYIVQIHAKDSLPNAVVKKRNIELKRDKKSSLSAVVWKP